MCCVCFFVVGMDAKHTANVVFFNVSDTYAVKWHGDITCYFTVDASILPGIRHIVGIFPINWQSTKDCIVCDWSPMPKDYQPQQPLDNCLKFSGTYCIVVKDLVEFIRQLEPFQSSSVKIITNVIKAKILRPRPRPQP